MPRVSGRQHAIAALEECARRALDSALGVRVYTNAPERLCSEFYILRKNLRKDFGDNSLDSLTVRVPTSASNEVWLIPQDVLEA